MKNEQVAQLQELGRCWMKPRETRFVRAWLSPFAQDDRMPKRNKATLRRLWHQYRHQIAAMKE